MEKPIKLKAGDPTFMKCVGYGLTSYERGEHVARVRKGVVSLEERDTQYDAATGQPIGGGSLGLTCSICVTQEEITNAALYIAENEN